jgi:hypothetical protein
MKRSSMVTVCSGFGTSCLQVTLEERRRVLATIRKEIGELEAEKKALQNKGATSASAADPQL